jgi:hypothetical protein
MKIAQGARMPLQTHFAARWAAAFTLASATLAQGAMAQSSNPPGATSSGIEVVGEVVYGVQPIEIIPVTDLDFGTVFIPVRADTSCEYLVHAAANRVEVSVNGDASNASAIRQKGLRAGAGAQVLARRIPVPVRAQSAISGQRHL